MALCFQKLTELICHFDARWVTDGSDGSILQMEGTTISLSSASRGTPFNVRYDAPLTGDWYFEVTLEQLPRESSISIGIVQPQEMQPGWKTRGMFFNGNLTNGSAALITSFGPYLRQGDTVGVYVYNGNKDVAFYHNQRCLGTAFSLPEESNETRYSPCLHVSGTAKVRLQVPGSVPSTTTREAPKQEGVLGDWKLVETVNEAGAHVSAEVPTTGNSIIMTVRNGSGSNQDSYALSLKVANTLSSRVKRLAGNNIQIDLVASTKMMPPPDLEAIERFLVASLPKLTSIVQRNDDDSLFLTSSGKLKLVFVRYVKTFVPLTKY